LTCRNFANYLESLAVIPIFHGHGIGRGLLQKGIAKGLELNLSVTLAVDPINDRAKLLYSSLGFQPAGTMFIFGHDYERWRWSLLNYRFRRKSLYNNE